MNSEFYKQIIKSNAGTNCRNALKKRVLDDAALLPDLIKIAVDTSDKNHYKAVWITEMIAETDTSLLAPFIAQLIDCYPQCKHQSAIRGMTRVVYFISVSKELKLTDNQQEKVIEICLDCLIGDAKVAPKMYAFTTLTHFCKKHEWIKEELKTIINKDFASQSAGYKAAARETLRKISK